MKISGDKVSGDTHKTYLRNKSTSHHNECESAVGKTTKPCIRVITNVPPTLSFIHTLSKGKTLHITPVDITKMFRYLRNISGIRVQTVIVLSPKPGAQSRDQAPHILTIAISTLNKIHYIGQSTVNTGLLCNPKFLFSKLGDKL